MSTKFYHSLQTVQKTISDQKSRLLWQSVRLKGRHLNVLQHIHHRFSFPQDQLYVISQPSSSDNVSVAIIKGHRKRTQNDRLIISHTVYREVL